MENLLASEIFINKLLVVIMMYRKIYELLLKYHIKGQWLEFLETLALNRKRITQTFNINIHFLAIIYQLYLYSLKTIIIKCDIS